MKKVLILFLTAVMLVFYGCENVEYIDQSSIAPESSSDIYDQIQSQLPSVNTDENGVVKRQPFTIVTDDLTAFYQDDSTAGSISRVLEERNTFLRDAYGAEIEVKEVEFSQLVDELEAAIENGTQYCDMISVSAENTVKLYQKGLLMDMNTLPGFDIEKGYFNDNWAKSLATNNSLYMLADPTAMVYDESYVLFFNRDLIEEDIEALVMRGEWTWEKFDEVSRNAAKEVYSHSSADLYNDVFAFGAYYLETVYPLAMWASCDKKIINNTYRNPVGVSMESEAIIEVADYLQSVLNVKGKYPLAGEDAATAFETGRLAFFCNKLSYLYALRDGSDLGSNFGFVPLPKYNAEQAQYNSLVSNDARVISVPKTLEAADAQKKSFVSTAISALCATGGSTIEKAFLDARLALYLNSNGETVMLEEVCDSITFDFATVFGSVITEIETPTIKAIADYLDYGSKLSSSLRKGKKTFEAYCAEHFT